MQETWVRSLGWEDPLEEGITTHSSILAWRILMDVGALWATVHGVCKGLDMTERLSTTQHRQNELSGMRAVPTARLPTCLQEGDQHLPLT